MKKPYAATGLMVGLAAAAISVAPLASAANPSTTVTGDRTTSVDKKGHNAIVVHPPTVSTPNSYGSFSSPYPFIMFD